LPLATSVIATNSGAPLFNLTVPKLRAVMDTRLTAMRTENGMETAMRKEIDELSRMTVGQLRQKYIEAFGEESRSNHKQFLFRRIAWRIQALAEGVVDVIRLLRLAIYPQFLPTIPDDSVLQFRSRRVVADALDLSPKLRQTVKAHFSSNGELSHGSRTKEVHERV
jgi:Protein of unknown function (DUF2924)